MIFWQGNYEQSATLLEDSLALHRALEEPWGMEWCFQLLGQLAIYRGDYERAATLLQEFRTLAHAQVMIHTPGPAWALLGLGDVAHIRGDAVQMERLCGEALTLCREAGDKQGEGYALKNLALAAWLQQDVPRATALFASSQALFQELVYPAGVAEVRTDMGRLEREQGHIEQARASLAEGLALARACGPLWVVADALEGLAGVAGMQQQAERAARLFGAAQVLREAKRMPRRPIYQDPQDGDVAATHEALGEEAFAHAWAEGEAMTLEQAIAYALEQYGGG